MWLPGGFMHQGQRLRQAQFLPRTGELELALSAAITPAQNHLQQVSAVLACAMHSIDGYRFEPEWADELCVADRQYLMCQLSSYLQPGPQWMTSSCQHCEQAFDFQLDYQAIPTKAANANYPCTTVPTDNGEIRIRVPTARDQQAIYSDANGANAQQQLLARLLDWPVDKENTALNKLSAELSQQLEQALEEMAPEVATCLQAQCPHCDSENQVAIDLYPALNFDGSALLYDIHTLATHYHWSEAQILALPQQRRQQYLAMIDGARGMHTQPTHHSGSGAVLWVS